MVLPERKPNRLPNFDYSTPGAYFITICIQNRKCTLCEIVGDGSPVPKPLGQITERWIVRIPIEYPCVILDKYVVMPNHIHILLRIVNIGGTGNPSPTLGNIIGWYKYRVTKEINDVCASGGKRFFQRSYHDHVIRNEKDYLKISEYIDSNPIRWRDDCFYKE